jgi:hypothetical protein
MLINPPKRFYLQSFERVKPMNQNHKVIHFTLNGISFDVATTGNAEADYQTGNTLMLLFLKNRADNFNKDNPIPPAPAVLQNIVSTLANDADFADIQNGFLTSLDMMILPTAHAMREMLDDFTADELLADLANVTAE